MGGKRLLSQKTGLQMCEANTLCSLRDQGKGDSASKHVLGGPRHHGSVQRERNPTRSLRRNSQKRMVVPTHPDQDDQWPAGIGSNASTRGKNEGLLIFGIRKTIDLPGDLGPLFYHLCPVCLNCGVFDYHKGGLEGVRKSLGEE